MRLVRQIRQRSFSSLLLSLCFHLLLLIVFSFLMIAQNPPSEEEFVGVTLMEVSAKPPKHRLPPPRRMVRRQAQNPAVASQAAPSTPAGPAEVLFRSERRITHNATLDRRHELTDRLPELTTIAENLRSSDEPRLSRAMSSRQLPGSGDGLKGFRQRAGGEGQGGLGFIEEMGTAAVKIPGEVRREPPVPSAGSFDQTPFGEALFNIGQHIANTSTMGQVDVVFVMDTSGSMQDNVGKVADHLFSMTDALDRKAISYRLGVVEFSVQKSGNKILTEPLTEDPAILQKRMHRLRISGDEHALDALINALTYLDFRGSADKYLILVTDEQASTAWQAPDAYAQLRKRIIQECQRRDIAVNVLGHREHFQRNLANLTGGLWQEIPGGQRGSAGTSEIPPGEKVARLFRDVGQKIWHTAAPKGKADIVIALDYSASMAGKVAALVDGLMAFETMMGRYPLDCAYGMIRFADQPERLGGLQGASIAQIPIEPGRLTSLLEYPFVGNEHLLDALASALPQIQYRPDTEKFLLVLTDEPSTGSVSPFDLIRWCQEQGIHVSVIGVLPAGMSLQALRASETLRTTEFQVLAPHQTGGAFQPMPGALEKSDDTQ